ncbi:MAG: hypothetical protein M4579_002888 [Chaenotheca gracillima]|nr:MAG: hypothetical protein M4579_002888 [Chaenotheca gracillima]
MESSPEPDERCMEPHSTGELADRVDASTALQSLLSPSIRTVARETPSSLECCCGRRECAFLKHNATALDGLEKDVQTAAQLGQALLARHEAYMVDAEQERMRLDGTIEQLEADKQTLQAENSNIIEENRGLLQQLEELNSSVTDSDAHIKSLSATLQSTQLELRRLTGLASRASELEMQLSALEHEQSQLQHSLQTTEDHERSAVQRWKNAERTLGDLENQIEKIEKEAREERERHVEIVGRLERRRAVERELDSAAGRLKGAAQWKTSKSSRTAGDGSNVVSHFVKDILQDNANLQIGVVELREMLLASNEEVENLRDQLVLHQPISHDPEKTPQPPPLSKELESETSKSAPQELHVHHHYHAPEGRAKEKPTIRKPKKKRNVITPGLFTPPSGLQTPRSSRSFPIRPTAGPSTATTILSQTAVTLPASSPPTASNRWSTVSNQTRSSAAPSSVPSSPQSAYRYSSMFDRAFSDFAADSSRPTSPESVDPSSPLFLPTHQKRGSDTSFRSFKAPTNASMGQMCPPPSRHLHPPAEENEDVDLDNMADLSLAPTGDDISGQPSEVSTVNGNRPPLDSTDSTSTEQSSGHDDFYAPTLRRSSSHESLLSVSGMDIHLVRDHPSNRFSKNRSLAPSTPLGLSSPSTTILSSQPVLSSETAFAQRPTMTRRGYDSSSYNRSLLRHNTPSSSNNEQQPNTPSPSPLGKRVGGWVFGKWGVSPMASTGNLRAQAGLATPARSKQPQPEQFRPPGINQAGPIWGLRPPAPAPTSVQASRIDEDLLRESLAE